MAAAYLNSVQMHDSGTSEHCQATLHPRIHRCISGDPFRMARRPKEAPAPRETYHHGDLRAALIDAAEALLAERGIEGFSLREVARRSGVSPAAPAHHFGLDQGRGQRDRHTVGNAVDLPAHLVVDGVEHRHHQVDEGLQRPGDQQHPHARSGLEPRFEIVDDDAAVLGELLEPAPALLVHEQEHAPVNVVDVADLQTVRLGLTQPQDAHQPQRELVHDVQPTGDLRGLRRPAVGPPASLRKSSMFLPCVNR